MAGFALFLFLLIFLFIRGFLRSFFPYSGGRRAVRWG
jgi:hypothetical protein